MWFATAEGRHVMVALTAAARRRVEREAGAYRRLHEARPGALRVPAVRHDRRGGVLEVRTVPVGWRASSGDGTGAVPDDVVDALGAALAALAAVPAAGWPRLAPPWVLAVHRPTAEGLWHAPAAVASLIRSVQADAGLCRLLDALARGWRATTPCHGDLRLANAVVTGPAGHRRVALVDWEHCGAGDPVWDAAGAAAALVAHAVWAMPVGAWACPAGWEGGAPPALAAAGRGCGRLWRHLPAVRDAAPRRVAGMVAARLLQYALEEARAGTPSPRGRACRDLAMALVHRPGAALRLLGLAGVRARPAPTPAVPPGSSARRPAPPSVAAEAVAAVAAAVRIRPPDRLWWCGRRVPVTVPPGDEPLLAAAALVSRLTGLIYDHAHRTGGVRPLPDAADAAPDPGDPPPWLGAALRAANRCPGTVDPGWRVSSVAGDQVHVARDGLRMVASAAAVRRADPEAGDLSPGEEVALVMPSERRAALPGYVVLTGPRDVDRPGEPTDRTYAHVTPDGAAALVAALTARLAARGLAYRLKAPADPDGYDRCDAVVLYSRPADRGAVEACARDAAADCAAVMRPGVPLFAEPLAAGLAMVASVPGDESHGWSCSRAVALHLVRAAHRHTEAHDEGSP